MHKLTSCERVRTMQFLDPGPGSEEMWTWRAWLCFRAGREMAPHLRHQSRCSSEHRCWQQTWHSRSLNTNTNLEIAPRDYYVPSRYVMDKLWTSPQFQFPRKSRLHAGKQRVPGKAALLCISGGKPTQHQWRQSLPICFTTWPSVEENGRLANQGQTPGVYIYKV